MANRLDIVAVAIVDEGAVVIGMILRAQPRRSIVLTARRDCRIIKRFDGCAIGRRESDMTFRGDRSARDPEIRPALPETDRFAEVHQNRVSERRQGRLKKSFAFRDVGNRQTDVIEHDWCLRRLSFVSRAEISLARNAVYGIHPPWLNPLHLHLPREML